MERRTESIMLLSKKTYKRCQPLPSIKPILIITYTINIISPQPLHHSNTGN